MRSGAIAVGTQGAQFVIQLAGTMVLARLLVPEHFGLIAMASVFFVVVSSFKDAGLAMATVQQKDITREQISTLFWINLGLTTVLGLVMVAAAPGVSWLYGRPELLGITITMGAVLAFGGLSIQHAALLRRQMRFGTLAVIQIGSQVVGVIVAIAMALLGFGYWSLVAAQVAALPVMTVATWLACGWIPSSPRRTRGVRKMLRFGGLLAAGNVLSQAGRKLDDLLIGWQLGAVPLGFYSKAYGLLLLPLKQINSPLTQVAIPALSRLTHDAQRFRDAYVRSLSITVLFSIGAVGVAFGAADNLILVVLGRQWLPAVLPYRALVGLAYVSALNGRGRVVIALGQTHKVTVSSLIGICVIIPAIMAGLPFGIVGVATALSIVSLGLCIVTTAYFYHCTPLKLSDFFACIWRQTAAALPAATLCYATGYICANRVAPLIALLLQTAVFGGAYLLGLLALPGGLDLLRDVARQLKHLVAGAPSSQPPCDLGGDQQHADHR